jgi:hypothetical protein
MFRFLKRTMNGIHLIKHCQQGVTIQFYMMLIVALLELHLKQEAMDIVSAKKSVDKTGKQEEKTTENFIPFIQSENLTSSCQEFIEILGKNVNKYWKIGIYWLIALRDMLASPFDEIVIEVLGTT